MERRDHDIEDQVEKTVISFEVQRDQGESQTDIKGLQRVEAELV